MFDTTYGGIGDFFKYFIYALNICIENEIKMYYLLEDIHINNYIKLKFNIMYITKKDLINTKKIANINELESIQQIDIDNSVLFTITPHSMYKRSEPKIYENVRNVNKFFFFTDIIKSTAHTLIKGSKEYISIHLRLGDKFLETEEKFKFCHTDERLFKDKKLFDFIEKHSQKKIIFFCDNNKYKEWLKKKYDFINITELDVAHTAYTNTTDTQCFNAIVEFFMLIKSKEIYCASRSGFSIMASKFENVPIYNI